MQAATERPQVPITCTIPNTETKSGAGGLKSYTAYIINVNDFGRQYTVERRFDDFKNLHETLSKFEPDCPPMPEKKFWGSADAQVVEERRPKFEKIIQHLVKSESCLFMDDGPIWKFLELSQPAMVATRFLFPKGRLPNLKTLAKTLDPKFQNDHAYRLFHEGILKANLSLVQADETLVAPAPPREGQKPEQAQAEADALIDEREGLVVDMIRHAISQGGEGARKIFLKEDGLTVMFKTLTRNANRKKRKDGVDGVQPDQKVRNVLNAMIQAENEKFPEAFSNFLYKGGINSLSPMSEFFQHSTQFHEFVAKLLWIAWEPEVMRAFLAEPTAADARLLLSQLFGCNHMNGRVTSGLLLSCVLARGGFAADPTMQNGVAGGLDALLEEVVMSSPVWSDGGVDGGDLGVFLQGLCKSDKGLARVTGCVRAVCEDSSVNEALWSATGFALWCLLKIKPASQRLGDLRLFLPYIAGNGPPRVRWLAGEMILFLHLHDQRRPGAETLAAEQTGLENALAEELASSQNNLQSGLQQLSATVTAQQELANLRSQSKFEASSISQFDEALSNLTITCSAMLDTVKKAQEQQTELENSITAISSDPNASMSAAPPQLHDLQELEAQHKQLMEQKAQYDAAVQEHVAAVEQHKVAMSEAEAQTQKARKALQETEDTIRKKQNEAHSARSAMASDFGSKKGELLAAMDRLRARQAEMRAMAEKIKAGDPSVPPGITLDSLKDEAAALKQQFRNAEEELAKCDLNPADLEEQARRCEQEAGVAQQMRDQLRMEQQGLEEQENAAREQWQYATRQLAEVRAGAEGVANQARTYEQRIESTWSSCQGACKQRLEQWHKSMQKLQAAQRESSKLGNSTTSTWDSLKAEKAKREKLLSDIGYLKACLDSFEQQLRYIDDSPIAHLE